MKNWACLSFCLHSDAELKIGALCSECFKTHQKSLMCKVQIFAQKKKLNAFDIRFFKMQQM